MQHGGMVFITKNTSDLRERGTSQFAGQKHGNLTWIYHLLGVVLGFKVTDSQTKLIRDHFLNGVNVDLCFLRGESSFQYLLRHSYADFSALQGGVSKQPI